MYRGILMNHMLPFANYKMPLWKLQCDNSPKHLPKLIKTFQVKQNLDVIKEPSQSADLNSIEYLWNYITHQLESYSFTNKAEMFLNFAF